jgi:Mrp family chromosome partitioning ATPase/capsular polysaccharide biosynthesis protein
MARLNGKPVTAPAWAADLEEPVDAAPILGYLRAIRAHWLLCLLIVLVTVGGSAAWLVKRSPEYVAKSVLLVSPVPETDTTLADLPLLRTAGGDPERPVKTAATLLDSPQVAERASADLGGEPSGGDIDAAVEVAAQTGENLVSVEATETDPELAATVANAYAAAALDLRRENLRPLVDEAIAEANDELAKLPPEAPRALDLQARLADLRPIKDGRDPTLRISQEASPPTTPEGLPDWLILAIAIFAGVVIAAAISILIEILVPGPITDEAEVRAAFAGPVLARLPRLDRRMIAADFAQLPLGAVEGFRTLRGQLQFRAASASSAGGRDGQRGPRGVIAIVSAGDDEGKTTVALGLARAAAAVRSRPLLIETDVHNPALAERLGLDPEDDLTGLLDGRSSIEAVAAAVPSGAGLELITAPRVENLRIVERLGSEIGSIIDRARAATDYVVVDAPPLKLASDSLAVVGTADQIVFVVRLGQTRGADIATAIDLLAQRNLAPDGVVIVGAPTAEIERAGERSRPRVGRPSRAPKPTGV